MSDKAKVASPLLREAKKTKFSWYGNVGLYIFATIAILFVGFLLGWPSKAEGIVQFNAYLLWGGACLIALSFMICLIFILLQIAGLRDDLERRYEEQKAKAEIDGPKG